MHSLVLNSPECRHLHRKIFVLASQSVLLTELVSKWKNDALTDEQILERFLDFTDSALSSTELAESTVQYIQAYAYRIRNRLLPREVYRFGGGTTSHAEGELLADFLTDLRDPGKGEQTVSKLEKAIGEQLLNLDNSLGPEWRDALCHAGVWLDIPKPPKFEDVNVLISSGEGTSDGVQIAQVFAISQWTQAYTAFRYYVRIFAFSEYIAKTETAAKLAMQDVVGIKGDRFYQEVRRTRS